VIYPTFYSKYESRYFEKRDIILFVGGSWRDLSFEAKGGREVCEAWLTIHKDFPDYQFVLLSDPAPSYVARLKEVKAVIGPLPRKALLTEIYPRAKAIVLPSMMDTVGYSVIEAMNYGVVPVVSDHFAMPELVGDAGIILKAPTGLWRSDGSHNPRFREELFEGPFHELAERIADSLHMLLSDDSLWHNLSNKAKKRMKSPPFSVESRNQSILQVYRKALQ
jgi:glycosyltransferase involved in cell wall biosynthesis